ncbi:uncharacterized protein DDB_G0290587-like [Actinia tenebrosa]|uniref:Uncharacterized protein DDB_G0290587-like n=1 Tax=Actinia tenebrosa TaxID=6105 RepID=A0A6P8HRN5_ACTTE|nr:uncharacterized protein DDB_G0290587-like [Actinia tenebrosa]
MKTIFLFLIFAGFSFQSIISAPINQVELLDERDVLKNPKDVPLSKRSKHHGISSSIDPLQELGRFDEAALRRNDNGLPAKRDQWRKSNKKQKSSCRSKDVRVKATNSTTSTMEPTTTTTPPTAAVQGDVSVDATREPATSTITLATSTMGPTTTTTPPTAAVQGDVSVDATGEPATSTITLATNTMEPSTTTTPTAVAAHVSSVALTAPAVEGSQDNIPLSGCTTSIPIKCYNAYHEYG